MLDLSIVSRGYEPTHNLITGWCPSQKPGTIFYTAEMLVEIPSVCLSVGYWVSYFWALFGQSTRWRGLVCFVLLLWGLGLKLNFNFRPNFGIFHTWHRLRLGRSLQYTLDSKIAHLNCHLRETPHRLVAQNFHHASQKSLSQVCFFYKNYITSNISID